MPVQGVCDSLEKVRDNRCYTFEKMYPLADCFKEDTTDIGLLVAMLDYSSQEYILMSNLLGYKGAIFESRMAAFPCKSGQKL